MAWARILYPAPGVQESRQRVRAGAIRQHLVRETVWCQLPIVVHVLTLPCGPARPGKLAGAAFCTVASPSVAAATHAGPPLHD